MSDIIRRGDVWLCDMSLVIGSEQGGKNYPVLILQNDIGNRFSPCTIACVISSKVKVKKTMPMHVILDAVSNGLREDSIVLTEQIRTIDRARLLHKLTSLSPEIMEQVDRALEVSVGLAFKPEKQLMFA